MYSFRSFTLLAALFSTAVNSYTLVDTYDHTNFFSEFDFFNGADPTEGFVDYVSKSTAENGLISTDNSQVYLGVDHTSYNPAGGRQSVRVTSQQAYSESN